MAAVLQIQEGKKLTPGQQLSVFVPCTVVVVLEQKEGHWLSPRRMLTYQTVLLEQDNVELKVTNPLSPALFLTADP